MASRSPATVRSLGRELGQCKIQAAFGWLTKGSEDLFSSTVDTALQAMDGNPKLRRWPRASRPARPLTRLPRGEGRRGAGRESKHRPPQRSARVARGRAPRPHEQYERDRQWRPGNACEQRLPVTQHEPHAGGAVTRARGTGGAAMVCAAASDARRCLHPARAASERLSSPRVFVRFCVR